jgi:hypothetical protein
MHGLQWPARGYLDSEGVAVAGRRSESPDRMKTAAVQDTTNTSPFFGLAGSIHWQTPQDILGRASHALGGIDLDPCAGTTTSIGTISGCRRTA